MHINSIEVIQNGYDYIRMHFFFLQLQHAHVFYKIGAIALTEREKHSANHPLDITIS